jgi:TonB family protein
VGLFVAVVIVHLALTTALREAGWNPGLALLVSGSVVLAMVLGGWKFAQFARAWRRQRIDAQRQLMLLPVGPCCVVWRGAAAEAESDMDWEPVGHVRARYPSLPRRLGIEGVAIVDFEINAQGQAKNIHCIDAWPHDVFYEAAREALSHAKFQLKPDVHPRFGQSYRMPFVFRISGAVTTQDRGRKARQLRPVLQAAGQAVEKLHKSA